uniref:Ig-like domain-containing protein n=1 Tax=Pygocentrus nattereri TaxID=42514 RepID=A0A3B4D4A7_PYGNA
LLINAIIILFTIIKSLFSCSGNRAAELISPYTAAVFTNEGENATLSCNYSGSVRSLYWYLQNSASPPQFLIADYSPPVTGISVKHRKEATSVDLIISSAAVSDSALYYCENPPVSLLVN